MGRADFLEFGNFESTVRAGSRAVFGYGPDHTDLLLVDTGTS
jgi:hypothetical protein